MRVRSEILIGNSILNSFSSRRERGYIFTYNIMWKAIPDIIKTIARQLRKESTFSEWILWEKVRAKRLWYRIIRQAPIYVFTEDSWLDRYVIPDFYCPDKKVIIEIDGSVHDKEEIFLLDHEKVKLLIQWWYRILRFKNIDINNDIDIVLERIWDLLSSGREEIQRWVTE